MILKQMAKMLGLGFLLFIFLFSSISIAADGAVTDDDDILDMIIPILASVKMQSTSSELQSSFEIIKGQPLKKSLTFSPGTSGYYTVSLANAKTDKKRIGSIQVTSNCGSCLQVEIPKKEAALTETLKYDFYAETGHDYQINLEFKEASVYSFNVKSSNIGGNDYLPLTSTIAFNAPSEPSVKTETMLQRDSLESSGIFSKIGFQNLYWTNGNLKIYIAFDSPKMIGFRSGDFPRWGTICNGINNDSQCKTKVIDNIINTASKWTEKTSLNFSKTDNWNDAHIRILVTDNLPSGVAGDSQIGIRSLFDMKKPSMRLSTNSVNSIYNTRTILHEFGHALGLDHEHVNPSLILDSTKVYDYCNKTPGLDTKNACDTNMFLNDELGTVSFTDYDPYSVMGYPIPTSLVVDKSKCISPNALYCNAWQESLSPMDIKAMQQAYPLRPYTVTYKAECTTGGTSLTGAGKNCDTKNLCSNAPKYYGFSYVTKSLYDSNGGNCDVQLKNVLSANLGGNTQIYGQVCYRAWASSPSGMKNINARGWAKCNIDASLLPVK